MTQKLVSINTISKQSNLPLIEFVESWTEDFGARSLRVESDDGKKSNLILSIGPEEAGGIILSGHTDVVPVEGQDWSQDPFAPWIDNDKLYGRGTCDMKGFIATVLSAVPQMSKLKRPLHIALSYDEEVGCLGAPRMIDKIREKLPPVSAVVIGEPTSMASVCANKGIAVLKTRVEGFETHSSQTHRGVSAVMIAARLVNFLDTLAEQLKTECIEDTGFVPPYSTIHVGVIHGGTAVNIISRHCEFTWDMRMVPSENIDDVLEKFQSFITREILPEMRRRSPAATIETNLIARVPGFEVNPESPAVELVQRLTGITSLRKVSYATEAGQFQNSDIPSVVCGPGSIDQAHQADEYIALEQMHFGDALIRKIIIEQQKDIA